MKKAFYLGLLCLTLFEILNVYFIMPMPGSQRMNSIDLAFFLFSWRWLFRACFLALVAIGTASAFRGKNKWIPAIPVIFTGFVMFLFNFRMTADHMFIQPENVVFKSREENKVPEDRLIIGIENKGEAKAYPIEFIAYHHQVRDKVGGQPVMVTYCSVCRSGRVFEPIVNGKNEEFRLVGMDHFNAMFEDATTRSWWRQATGEAVAGKLKGALLPEFPSQQMTVKEWFDMYPTGQVMQADAHFLERYDSLARFEKGKSKGSLTRTDSLSWQEKSWVVGIQVGNNSKAYDWMDLKKENIINDTIGSLGIVLVLGSDGQSFMAFERPLQIQFTIHNDTIYSDSIAYDFSGKNLIVPSEPLKRLNAYQEFWHSWRSFHPETKMYIKPNAGHP